jgi:polyphenol oxidase
METIIPDEQSLAETGFYWRGRDDVKVLVCRPLENAGFTNGFSTRTGGVSPFPDNSLNLAGFDEDSPKNILENRRRFLNIFETNYKLTSAWQVHGDNVKVVATEQDVENTEEKFDALVSDLPGILIGVKTADCVPVLIGDPATSAFAAVHAGWRGTSKSIVSRAVEKMSEAYGSEPSDLICAVGPAALCGRYEVGQDVIDAFASNFPVHEKYFSPTRDGHALVDLHLANKDQLTACGVKAPNIFTAPFCTIERTDLFFSYRVEKKLYGKAGRMMSVIGLK